MKIYTSDELSRADGEGGKPTLVAVNGTVYDLSSSRKWTNGTHMKRHRAGTDLTSEIGAAPHESDVLERFPAVGTLQPKHKDRPDGALGKVQQFLDRHPFFQRHPHPAVVHVPVGVILVVALFELLAVLFRIASLELAALYCLVVVLASVPVAIATGYFTWWVNYECASSPIVSWKQRLAWVALLLAIVAVALRLNIVHPLRLEDPLVLGYLVNVVVLTGILSYVGFLGGKLTFPYE